jgi:formylglycine-generating enzyme
VNETILDREGIIKYDVVTDANDDNTFHTRTYLAGQYDFIKKGKKPLSDFSKKKKKDQKRFKVNMEDGIFLPEYRLPTEAEWEYAAQANIGDVNFNNVEQKKIYGWNDYTIRIKEEKRKRSWQDSLECHGG